MHLSPNLVLATLVFLPTVAMAVVVTSTSDPTVRAEPAKPLTATANLVNLQGKSIGTATLTQVQDGVNVAIAARSLPKNTTLAWHIHQTGTCDLKGKFASAGSHFNPLEKSHGFEHAEGHHAGDLPNLQIGDDGVIATSVTTPNISLMKGVNTSVFDKDGSAIVIHTKADDYKSQPAGDAGDRLACGVIKASN
ncbi:MAG: superoxide dismutase family protein [Blastochloris viridis]|uniref:Superoxide dismutase [Cu-Zn] n=1 Tax=Blastochloris viridis TaxID=1079 RepID=A0A6N4QY21_BLAVI|nr:MAG: superoxide dismutase family protein [Blastochloris viridis]